MRRTVVAFLSILFLFMFVGCSKKEIKAEEINFNFQCKADVACGEQKITCELNRSAPGIVSIQILSGDLKGLVYNWSGEDFSVSYSGLAAKSEDCVLPKASFAVILKQMFDQAATSGALTKTHGNEFSGNFNDCDFTLVTNGIGQIQKISIPHRGISAELYDYNKEAAG
jgi:hypothetical protein